MSPSLFFRMMFFQEHQALKAGSIPLWVGKYFTDTSEEKRRGEKRRGNLPTQPREVRDCSLSLSPVDYGLIVDMEEKINHQVKYDIYAHYTTLQYIANLDPCLSLQMCLMDVHKTSTPYCLNGFILIFSTIPPNGWIFSYL